MCQVKFMQRKFSAKSSQDTKHLNLLLMSLLQPLSCGGGRSIAEAVCGLLAIIHLLLHRCKQHSADRTKCGYLIFWFKALGTTFILLLVLFFLSWTYVQVITFLRSWFDVTHRHKLIFYYSSNKSNTFVNWLVKYLLTFKLNIIITGSEAAEYFSSFTSHLKDHRYEAMKRRAVFRAQHIHGVNFLYLNFSQLRNKQNVIKTYAQCKVT